jgi:hypothetical protein
MVSGKATTPREVGNSLFQNLLKKINEESSQAEDFIGLFQDLTPDQKLIGNQAETKTGSQTLKNFIQTLEKLGFNRGLLTLKDTSLPTLISLLQQKNIGQDKIEQLLEALKDKNGNINLDRLLSKILQEIEPSGIKHGGMIVEAKDVPRFQEFLFQCGLGVEEVKAIFEKSVNSKGDLALSRLSSQLPKYLIGDNSESRLLSVLARLNIQPKKIELDPKMIEKNWGSLLKQNPDASSLPIENKLKQELAALLREKGVPPEEVKSFLETLSLKQMDVKAPMIRPVSSTNLLEGVVISNGRDWQSSPWKEKILKILLGDQYQTKQAAYKGETNTGESLSNLSDLFKSGDKGFRNELFQYLSQGKSLSNQEEMGQLLKEISDKIKGQNKVQEPIAFELNLKKPGMEPIRIETATTIRQDRNLNPPLPRILDRMIFMVRGGIQRSRMMIHPPELGRLDLDLSIKQGHLQAHLSAESTVVKELIEANLNHLRQQLSDQGLVVEKFEVMLGLNDQKSADSRNGMTDEKRFSRSSRGGRTPRVSSAEDEEKQDKLITDLYQIDVRA